jgi:hypothetical protein
LERSTLTNMKVNPVNILIFFVVPLFTSCASSYKAIQPEKLEYHNQSTNDNIEFSYHYDVLTESRNKKYAKHEIKNHINLVAVKITNHTGHDLNLMNDVVFYINNKPVYPVDQKLAHDQMKQGVPIYLLYLLLTPMTVNTGSTSSDGSSKTNSFPAGLIIGPAITGLNLIIAGTANKDFNEELETYSLYRQMRNGETIYGLVAFKDIGMDEISLRLK